MRNLASGTGLSSGRVGRVEFSEMIGNRADEIYIWLVANDDFLRRRDRPVIDLEHALPIGAEESVNARSL